MAFTADEFHAFIAEVKLPEAPFVSDALAADDTADFEPAASSQAVVVGSEVVGFADGVDPSLRKGFVSSLLLAQLVAEARVGNKTDVAVRHAAMREVLVNLGWLIVDEKKQRVAEKGDDLDAHTAILAVATSALGGVALAILQTVIDQIRTASGKESWFKLFSRKSIAQQVANYQLSTISASDAGVQVSLMNFLVQADTDLLQIAFFRSQTSAASLDVHATAFGVDADTLRARADAIGAKVAAFQSSYIAALELPQAPGA
jgi:hypothetical protein